MMVEVCPECEKTNIQIRSSSMEDVGRSDCKYFCGECGADFDEPDEREQKKYASDSLRGLAGQLDEADTVDDIVTDGGRTYSDTQFMSTNNNWHDCDGCGAAYRSRAPAVRCCDGYFGGEK